MSPIKFLNDGDRADSAKIKSYFGYLLRRYVRGQRLVLATEEPGINWRGQIRYRKYWYLAN